MKNIGKPCAGKPQARFDEGREGYSSCLLYPIVGLKLSQDFHSGNRFFSFLHFFPDYILFRPPFWQLGGLASIAGLPSGGYYRQRP